MSTRAETAASRVSGLDGIALKPTECDVGRAASLPLDEVTVDYEGRDAVPEFERLAAVADAGVSVRLTTPVRADGFDPLGDDALDERIPDNIGRVVVAGHPAYLSESERSRAVAPRLRAARDRNPEAWVGTEGVERIALAAGGTQFELLSRSTLGDIRGLRAAGYQGSIAIYAPTVLTDDTDAVLDAVGEYVARRGPVKRALPEECDTGAEATGRARQVLSAAAEDFALVGETQEVRTRVEDLKQAGADKVIGYPARGLDTFLTACDGS